MGRNYPKIVNLSLYQSWNYLMVFFKDRENMTIWQFYNDKETSWDFEITKILWHFLYCGLDVGTLHKYVCI
jgi:hypothetical protein